MIVEKIRQRAEVEVRKDRQTGWPTGSRFGNCAAALQFLRYPEVSKPEPATARQALTWEMGRQIESWLAGHLEKSYPGLVGLRGEPFYFSVPLDAEEAAELRRRIENRAIGWAQIRPGFKRPTVRLVDGKVRARLLPCNKCSVEGREHGWPCGKRIGFVLDPASATLWVPVYIDFILKHDELGGVVLEAKSLSDYAFRRALLGALDYRALAQLAGEAEATGLDVVWLGVRKETQHLIELAYTRKAERVRLRITRLNGQQETFFLPTGGGADALTDADGHPITLPGDAEWEVAETLTPWRAGLLEEIRARIKRVLLAKPPRAVERGGWTLYPEVWREAGPDFICRTCDGSGQQTLAKAARTPLKGGPKPCPDCAAGGKLDTVELPFPCSYCNVIRACYPFARLELDSRPHWRVERADWEKTELVVHPPTAAVVNDD